MVRRSLIVANCLMRSAALAELSYWNSSSSVSRFSASLAICSRSSSREMAADLIGRKHTSYFRDKSRKLPGESRMLRGGAGEVHQFLSDRIVKRRLKPKALSDGSTRFALLDPNLMMIARTHELALATIRLSER